MSLFLSCNDGLHGSPRPFLRLRATAASDPAQSEVLL
jgi:hypothetical protein